jgi:hypothetical protein
MRLGRISLVPAPDQAYPCACYEPCLKTASFPFINFRSISMTKLILAILFTLAPLAANADGMGALPAAVSCSSDIGTGFHLTRQGEIGHVVVTDPYSVSELAQKMGASADNAGQVFKSVEFDLYPADFFGISADRELISSFPTTKVVTFRKGDSGSTPMQVPVLGGGGHRGMFEVARSVTTNVYGTYTTMVITVGFRTKANEPVDRIAFAMELDAVHCQ